MNCEGLSLFNEAGSQTDTTNPINASLQSYYTFDKYHFS